MTETFTLFMMTEGARLPNLFDSRSGICFKESHRTCQALFRGSNYPSSRIPGARDYLLTLVWVKTNQSSHFEHHRRSKGTLITVTIALSNYLLSRHIFA